MLEFFQLVVSGLTSGAVYALTAMGFSLIYGSTGVFNFAQGDFAMLGGVLFASGLMEARLTPLLALPLAMAAGAVAAAFASGVTVFAFQRRNVEIITKVMASLAVALMLSNGVRIGLGSHDFYAPPIWRGDPLKVLGIFVGRQQALVIVVTTVVMAAFWYFVNRTMPGLAMRAVRLDPTSASLMGINLSTTIVFSFVLSGALSALGGALVAPIVAPSARMGLATAVRGFIGAVLGGIQDPFAAAFGGFILGMLEAFVAGYISSGVAEAGVFALLPVMLMARPYGMFGKRA